MANLPKPGDQNWAEPLNDFLLAAHQQDGSLKEGSVGRAQLQDGALTPAKFGNKPIAFDVPVTAPNLPRKISVGNKSPSKPQDGDIWFDTSAAQG